MFNPTTISSRFLIICLLLGNLDWWISITKANDAEGVPTPWRHYDLRQCYQGRVWRCSKPFIQWQRSFQRKLRFHWLKFLPQCHVAVVRQGHGTLFNDLPMTADVPWGPWHCVPRRASWWSAGVGRALWEWPHSSSKCYRDVRWSSTGDRRAVESGTHRDGVPQGSGMTLDL